LWHFKTQLNKKKTVTLKSAVFHVLVTDLAEHKNTRKAQVTQRGTRNSDACLKAQ